MTILRCQTCGTPDVMVILPGSDDVRGPGGIIIERGEPIRCWCEAHARAAGWPWGLESERARKTGQTEFPI